MVEGWTKRKHIAIDVLVMFVVCCFSLSMLIYVAEGDAGKVYQSYYRAAVVSQGHTVQTEITSFLSRDMPLEQFASFNALTDPLLDRRSSVGSVSVVDDRGKIVFSMAQRESATPTDLLGTAISTLQGSRAAKDIADDIVFPLRTKFETVGNLVLTLRLDKIKDEVSTTFRPLWLLVGACSLAFALLTFSIRDFAWKQKRIWTAATFIMMFTVVAGITTGVLVGLYTDGATAKGKALLASLSGRLDDLTASNIGFDQIDGLDRLFTSYRQVEADASTIALVIDGIAKVHTDVHRVGLPWTRPDGSFEFVSDISAKGGFHAIKIVLTMPKDIVYQQIADSVRNILALFVASGLFAYFSMSVARSLQDVRESKSAGRSNVTDFGIGLIKPVFFLATFTENLNYAFLPQYVQNVAKTSGLSVSLTSLPFMAFYLCFALSLLPGERMAGRLGPRKLAILGLAFVSAGLVVMAGGFGMVSIIFARALSGVGQGFVFIGVQCYILCATGRESRTRGGSVIVIGFQAGMMAGMAIGSLLVSQLGSQGVFELGAVIAIITAFYTAVAVPYVKVTDAPEGNSLRQVWQNIALTLRDPEFLKAMWLIGLPAKAVLTGVVLFALPLLLAKLGYRQEDVGQITMSYGASVIAASAWVSARESKGQGSTGGVLVRGALFSGLGLLAISALGWQFDGASLVHVVPSAIIILAGAISVGIGHGFINAPVVTQVTHSRVSNLLGAGPVAATYRLLERGGHTAGPIIVSQVLAVTGSGTAALGWIGAVLITLGVAFAFSLHDNTGRPVEGVA